MRQPKVVVALVVIFAAFALYQYVAVSNWNFTAEGDDTGRWRKFSLLPLNGSTAQILATVSPVFLQPLKAVIDHENHVVLRRIGRGPSVVGKFLLGLNSLGKIRAFHVGFALLNSTVWLGAATLAIFVSRKLRKRRVAVA